MKMSFSNAFLKLSNVSGQYNGGFLHNIMLLTLCYYHQGTRLDVIKSFSLQISKFPPKRLSVIPALGKTSVCF